MENNLRKEKNLIYFTNKQNRVYTFDINTATLYGVKGKPIKLYNRELYNACANVSYYISEYENSELYYCLYRLLKDESTKEKIQETLLLADSLENAGIKNFARYGSTILDDTIASFILQNKKTFFKIAKTSEEKNFRDIYEETLRRKVFNRFNLDTDNERDMEIYRCLKSVYNDYRYRDSFENKDIELLIYYLKRDDVFYTFSSIDFKGKIHFDIYRVKDIVCDYLLKAKEIGYTPTKDNLYYQVTLVKKTFLAMMNGRVERNLEKLYSTHTKVWEYEDDTFKIVIPKTEKDFQNEANQQHNCVYNLYLEKAVENQTHICFFRKKDDLEKSYITCEIKNGKIIQFLKAYNQRISSEEDKKLYIEFSDFLSQNW